MRHRNSVVGLGLACAATLFVAPGLAPMSAWAADDGVSVRPADRADVRSAARMRAAAARLGLPPGGPDVLYAPVADVPQVQNRDTRFRLPFGPVSGTDRYAGGEYAYTDFIYDDENTTYPEDFDRYAGNAADLAEVRISTRDPRRLAVRFTLTTLVAEDSTIMALAFDSDRDAGTGEPTLPRDPGAAFPGTDHVLTTWGSGAEWSTWTGSRWRTAALPVRTDLEANQVTVSVPRSVAAPRGTWRATLATGLHDPASGGWLPGVTATGADVPVGAVGSSGDSAIVNLGFRFGQVDRRPPGKRLDLEAPDPAPWAGQYEALAAGEPTRFARDIDFGLLRRGGTRDTVPERGMMYRVFASRSETVMVATDGTPANGNPREVGEGKDVTSLHGRYLSPLQPYALYVPRGYRPGRPAPLTFAMHGDGGEYFWLAESSNYSAQLFGEERDSIVLSPSARGRGGFYVGDHEIDVFEAWNDAARHYELDPRRTSLTGYSMGGHGSYRLGLLHPHLFARSAPVVPAICRGMWLIARCTTTEETVANRWVENARNLPFFHLADSLSELTFYPGQAQHVLGPAVNGLQSLESLGYRYRLWSVATDHIMVGTNHPEVRDFLGHHVIEPRPFHVTFARMPSTDLAAKDLVHDRAYWLSGIEVRDDSDPLAKGVVEAVSGGFGLTAGTSRQRHGAGVTTEGIPYVETERTWSTPRRVARTNTITIDARNIGSLTIDPVAARVGCDVELDVITDGPIEIRLLGC